MSRFMRFAWSEVLDPHIEVGWLKNTLAVHEGEADASQKHHVK